MLSIRTLLCVTLFALVTTACGPELARLPREEGFHPRLTRFGYIEEGKLVSFGVDTEATRRREGDPFIPFAIGVANIGLPELTLTRESLTLIDDEGNRYPMATIQEARSLGATVRYDQRLSEAFVGAFAGRFDAWPRVSARFFPTSGGGLRDDHVELPKRTWAMDLVYFPHPEGDLLGRKYEVWLDTEELEEPVFVKLQVR